MKKLKFILALILMLIVTTVFINIKTVDAGVSVSESLHSFSQNYSYDQAKDFGWGDGKIGVTSTVQEANVICIENYSLDYLNDCYLHLRAIIDIDSDGTGTITTSSGTNALPVTGNSVYLNKMLAGFAYYADNLGMLGSQDYQTTKIPFMSLWDGKGSSGINYRNYINLTGLNWATTSQMGNTSAASYQFAKNYAEGATEKTYVARAFLFYGATGGVQDKIVLFGKEGVSTPKFTIDKYITKINVPSSGTINGVTYEISGGTQNLRTARAGKTDSEKRSNAPTVIVGGTTVEYEIVVTNTGTTPITDGVFSDTYSSGLSKDSGTTSDSNVNIQPGQSKKYTVKLKLGSVSDGTEYTNTATFTVAGTSLSSRDYVVGEVPSPPPPGDPSGDIIFKKYITAVNGVAVSDRSSFTNTQKNNDPVEVKKGDTVTFKVKATNNYDLDQSSDCDSGHDELTALKTLTFTDTVGSGLSYPGGSNFTYTWRNVPYQGTVETTFNMTVTASNMTLLNIPNTVSGFRGTAVHYDCYSYEVTTYDDEGEPDGTETIYVHPNYAVNPRFSGSSSDYVRLLDPEIAGTVWLDSNSDGYKNGSESLTGMTNEQKNITVELWNSTTGSMVASQKINSTTGNFSFGRVRKGDARAGTDAATLGDYNIATGKHFYYTDAATLYHYYLIYDYDGERYIATTDSGSTHLNSSTHAMENNFANDSNASELNRTTFNNSLETIAYNKAYNGSAATDTSKTLAYNSTDGSRTTLASSELKWDGVLGTATTSNITMKAQSFELFYVDGETDYLKHINLGLCTRDTADLELKKDVYQAVVEINGYKTVYTYDKLNNGVTSSGNAVTSGYNLDIYNSDYTFRTAYFGDALAAIKGNENPYKDDYSILDENGNANYVKENDLKIFITYEINIKNSSASAKYAKVREITDYSSNEMTLREVKMSSLTGTNLTFGTTSTYNTTSKYSYTGYNTAFITGSALSDVVLAKDDSMNIYLTYRVNTDASENVYIDSSTGDLGKVNIAEIGAFSIYDNSDASTPSGLVDIDSNPGSINTDVTTDVTSTAKYEDDTFRTTIYLKLRDNPPDTPPDDPTRTIEGIVWEDLNGTTLSSEQKVGDGVKTGSESGIKAENEVRVKLLEVINDTANNKEYLVDTGIETKTIEGGTYKLVDNQRLHAGQYVVRFIYGSNKDKLTTADGNTIRFSGQDYKSTVYKEIGTSDENEVVEATAFTDTSKSTGENKVYSFARDNELRRLEVVNYSTEMINPLDNILKSTSTTGDMAELAKNTAMLADTKKFNVQVEYKDNYTTFTDKIFDGMKTISDKIYSVKEVNFGLIERPKTKLQLMNDITEIIAKTSDSNELIHLYFDIAYTKDGNSVKHTATLNTVKSKGFENVQVLNRSTSRSYQGFRYINIDTNLLQGMTVTLKFQMAIANNSEIDTSNQNLINMVKNYNVGDVATYLKGQTTFAGNQVYRYNLNNTLSDLEKTFISSYSYSNLKKAVNSMKTSGNSAYKTYVNDVASDEDYTSGYFIGKTYYTGSFDSSRDRIAETRIDQVLDYVDNDLVFKAEDNPNNNGNLKFVSYSISEIAQKQLLHGITETSVISDGKQSYIVEEQNRNNLAFSIEDSNINENLYRYLKPLKGTDTALDVNSKLYLIDLQASRTLASEEDINGVSIDNLSEIVKISNTVGRKAYIEDTSAKTGYIGNSTDKIAQTSTNIMLASTETDTDYTEYVTFSPPTGLTSKEITEQKAINNTLIIVLVVIIVVGTVYIIIKFVTKKKFYK